jgi:hypothetical protein
MFMLMCVIVCIYSAEAQECYVKTAEYAYGNEYVKALNDSVCIGQWYDTLYCQNYRSQEVYFKMAVVDYYDAGSGDDVFITEVAMLDTLLIIEYEWGRQFALLHITADSAVEPLFSDLDSMPTLRRSRPDKFRCKIRLISDSVFVIGNATAIYSFRISDLGVCCIDSLLYDSNNEVSYPWEAVDDTIVLLIPRERMIKYYTINSDGNIRWVKDEDLEDIYYANDISIRNSYIYIYYQYQYNVLVRKGEHYEYREGPRYMVPHPILILDNTVACIDLLQQDRMDIYDSELTLICTKTRSDFRDVMSSSSAGDKILISKSDGISTWVPNTVTTVLGSISTIRNVPRVTIWPNPSVDGYINIHGDRRISSIRITDRVGREVFRRSGIDSEYVRCNVAGNPVGTFYLYIMTEDAQSTKKCIMIIK